MNNPNPENPPPPPPPAQPGVDTRKRLRELLSVPERDRTDEQWDEIIELEIQLAPGNRIAGNEAPAGQPRHNNQQRHGKQGGGNHQNAGAGAGAGNAQQKKHRPRTKNNRRPRQGGKPGGEAA
jgi:hypothetical protein